MSPFLLPLLWGQVPAPPQGRPPVLIQWLYAFGDPRLTVEGFWGGPMTWIKVVALLTLFCWAGSWILAGFKERVIRGMLPAIVPVGAVILALAGAILATLQESGRVPAWNVANLPLPVFLMLAAFAVLILWVEVMLWPSVIKLGKGVDILTLLGIHAGLALGYLVTDLAAFFGGQGQFNAAIIVEGARIGTTYMGYAVLLRLVGQLLVELFALRGRRLRAIAWHSVIESTRRMWAPWVVLVLFVVVLAFTHWFLDPPRGEMGRMYVSTLMFFISIVLTAMIVILAPLSLPNDIQMQTIYTVVSKPVRRLEMIWGRMIGFMALVTMLLVVFGGISLLYIERQVNLEIADTKARLEKARESNLREQAQQLENQLAQLNARQSARVPLKGSLMFEDSLGKKTPKGIDVGQELEYRSFIEGATPSRAVWRYGRVIDPYDELFPDPKRTPMPPLERQLPVTSLLRKNTIEWYANEEADAVGEKAELAARRDSGRLALNEAQKATARIAQLEQEAKQAKGALDNLKAKEKGLRDQIRDLEAQGKSADAGRLRDEVAALHTKDLELQMTFNVYRTTKGAVGEPVYASIRILDFTEQIALASDIRPIREYYTNSWKFPASVLVGSRGHLKVEVKCISPTQYLGMSEGDLYILNDSGSFWFNYLKGLFGVWLQAMVLTAVGVFAGTFLSWPVALLLTIFFFLFGQIAYSFLQAIAVQSLLGGGPFESFIRMMAHNNQVSDLAPTLPVVIAKALDSVVMPVLSRLVYVIPNLSALDVSTPVADGFALDGWDVLGKFLMALGYAVPFSIAGFFILKQREVAA